jgi:hypothetical protein
MLAGGALPLIFGYLKHFGGNGAMQRLKIYRRGVFMSLLSL